MDTPKLLVQNITKTFGSGRQSLETLATIDLTVAQASLSRSSDPVAVEKAPCLTSSQASRSQHPVQLPLTEKPASYVLAKQATCLSSRCYFHGEP